jgi:hypothetical protein
MAIDLMWYANLESRVFTMVSTAMQAYLTDRYPSWGSTVMYTTQDKLNADPGLPVFYMFQNDTDEILMDLQNHEINGVLARFQCEAFAADEDTAKAIAYAGVMHMKKLGFECMFFPKVSLSRDGVVRVVARYKRPIGSGETKFTED